jgi:hypothetical protein
MLIDLFHRWEATICFAAELDVKEDVGCATAGIVEAALLFSSTDGRRGLFSNGLLNCRGQEHFVTRFCCFAIDRSLGRARLNSKTKNQQLAN